MRYVIKGGIIVDPLKITKNTSLVIEGKKIKKISKENTKCKKVINLNDNDLIFPGLINSHDHLLGTYFPRVGAAYYINWLPWDNDLKDHPIYEERSLISNKDLYLLGTYKNIISGVTSVSDHMPHFFADTYTKDLPINAIKDYTAEHECSSYDLRWGRGITVEHNEAKKNDIPFITHIEEGFDEEATLGIDILSELNALDEYTVLIHGIALSDNDIDLIAEKKANLVWCPSSNYFMFNQTTNIKRLLEKKVNVALGTDSPMSGGLNLLDEMKFAKELYYKLYNENLDSKIIVEMVTVNAAKALRLKNKGEIKEGYDADILILKNGNPDKPYKSLVEAWFEDIGCVIYEGKPIYGISQYEEFYKLFDIENYQRLKIENQEFYLIDKPVDLYKRISEAIGYKKDFPFFPIKA